jgi:hypothetical protein
MKSIWERIEIAGKMAFHIGKEFDDFDVHIQDAGSQVQLIVTDNRPVVDLTDYQEVIERFLDADDDWMIFGVGCQVTITF